MTPRDFSERGLVEEPTLALLAELGYETADGYTELSAPITPSPAAPVVTTSRR